MKPIHYLYLTLFFLLFISCSSELSHHADQESPASISETSQFTMQQRSEIAKSRSQIDEFTRWDAPWRSEEHTSELQSRGHLVCRLLLEKNKHAHQHIT